MTNKVTKRIFKYQAGFEPNVVIPETYCEYRLVLGRATARTLAVMGMNPSAASEQHADATIAKVIKTAQMINCDGWLMFNLYPERATNASFLESFDEQLHQTNVEAVIKQLKKHHITEVWGAWGNLNHQTLQVAKEKWLAIFEQYDIKVFHFNELTIKGNPKHPLYLKIDPANKKYF